MRLNFEKESVQKRNGIDKRELLTFFYDVVASLYDISPEMITFL